MIVFIVAFDLEARVRFLWGKRGTAEGAGATCGAGWEVRGKRPPAAAAPAANSTTIHHLDITRHGMHGMRKSRSQTYCHTAASRLTASYAHASTFTFVVR
ncbi:unnamed protein product [Arctia plantaginis]|uniref:Uncharacterized protein n=1 Tax=Arctia plantaginis TaxID=874455 RepID=A0A8S0YXI9_ARCPL|nr:unnamed protein product [Arctia plantaginis]